MAKSVGYLAKEHNMQRYIKILIATIFVFPEIYIYSIMFRLSYGTCNNQIFARYGIFTAAFSFAQKQIHVK